MTDAIRAEIVVKMNIGKKMRAIRESFGDTTTRLGKELDINQASITKYETGTLQPPLTYLYAFCKYYGVSADFLIGINSKEARG